MKVGLLTMAWGGVVGGRPPMKFLSEETVGLLAASWTGWDPLGTCCGDVGLRTSASGEKQPLLGVWDLFLVCSAIVCQGCNTYTPLQGEQSGIWVRTSVKYSTRGTKVVCAWTKTAGASGRTFQGNVDVPLLGDPWRYLCGRKAMILRVFKVLLNSVDFDQS